MDKGWQDGDWLLLDAAGPELVLGLLRDGRWLNYETHADGFIESLQKGVEAILAKASINLQSLHGIVFATGPGSTLGLRLAAMFVRTLLQLPELRHWRCLTYNNLELACAAEVDSTQSKPFQIGAPWRKNRLHRATFNPGDSRSFALDTVDLDNSQPTPLPVVVLGNRASTLPADLPSLAYPSDRIPEILADWPVLLKEAAQPDLYSAEDPDFARWTSSRHPQK